MQISFSNSGKVSIIVVQRWRKILSICDCFDEEYIKGVNEFWLTVVGQNSLLKMSRTPQWILKIFYVASAYKWCSAELNKLHVYCWHGSSLVKQLFLQEQAFTILFTPFIYLFINKCWISFLHLFLGPRNNDMSQPTYSGFERDVFRTVADYFVNLPEPLLTFEYYELFVNILGMYEFRNNRASYKFISPGGKNISVTQSEPWPH